MSEREKESGRHWWTSDVTMTVVVCKKARPTGRAGCLSESEREKHAVLIFLDIKITHNR